MPYTLPFSKNNPIKVTLTNGKGTVLAKITRFNEETGKVCWIDLDRKWKGSMHVTHVVRAEPKEIADRAAAAAAAAAAKAAPVDAVVSKWEIGPMRRGPMMMEGYYFASTILYEGKRVGKIVDRGDGGMTDLEFSDYALQRQFVEDTKKWAEANGAEISPYVSNIDDFWDWFLVDRPNGITAKTYFAEKKAEMAKWLAKHTPIHTGNLALVNGQI
jgi:hypothetical protein